MKRPRATSALYRRIQATFPDADENDCLITVPVKPHTAAVFVYAVRNVVHYQFQITTDRQCDAPLYDLPTIANDAKTAYLIFCSIVETLKIATL